MNWRSIGRAGVFSSVATAGVALALSGLPARGQVAPPGAGGLPAPPPLAGLNGGALVGPDNTIPGEDDLFGARLNPGSRALSDYFPELDQQRKNQGQNPGNMMGGMGNRMGGGRRGGGGGSRGGRSGQARNFLNRGGVGTQVQGPVALPPSSFPGNYAAKFRGQAYGARIKKGSSPAVRPPARNLSAGVPRQFGAPAGAPAVRKPNVAVFRGGVGSSHRFQAPGGGGGRAAGGVAPAVRAFGGAPVPRAGGLPSGVSRFGAGPGR